MSVRLTHGDLAALGIGHEPWCPHGKTQAGKHQSECWCEFDARAERARQAIDAMFRRWNAS